MEEEKEELLQEVKEKSNETKQEQELIQGYRIFALKEIHKTRINKDTNEPYKEIYIYHPTIGDEEKIDDYYSRIMAKLIRDDNYMTENELLRSLNRRGIWSKKEDYELEKMNERILTLSGRLIAARSAEAKDPEQIEKWTKEREDLKVSRNELNNTKQKYISSTIEATSSREQQKKKMQLCCKFPDGKLIWETIDALNSEEDRTLVYEILYESMLFWSGLNASFLGNYLEETIGGLGT